MKMLLVAAATLSTVALASSWEVDPSQAAVTFTVRHLTVSNIVGTLGKVKGKVNLDEADVTRSTVEVSVDAADISSGDQRRDDHFRSKHFLNVDKFPAVSFKSTAIEKAANGRLKVTGDLTIRDVTKSVVLDTEVSGAVTNPITKEPTRGVTASVTIPRKDFGMTWNVPVGKDGVLMSDDVKVVIDLELVQRAPAAAKK